MPSPVEVCRRGGVTMEEEEALMKLNTINSSGGFVVVSTDKLSVKYTSVNLHDHDVGVIQANKPAPMMRLIYYFEIQVTDAGVKGQITIGFTYETFKMRRQPGSVSSRMKKVVLVEDDIRGIQYLYGTNLSYNGTTATSSPERDASERWSPPHLSWVIVDVIAGEGHQR